METIDRTKELFIKVAIQKKADLKAFKNYQRSHNDRVSSTKSWKRSTKKNFFSW